MEMPRARESIPSATFCFCADPDAASVAGHIAEKTGSRISSSCWMAKPAANAGPRAVVSVMAADDDDVAWGSSMEPSFQDKRADWRASLLTDGCRLFLYSNASLATTMIDRMGPYEVRTLLGRRGMGEV